MTRITFANKKNLFIKSLRGKVDQYFATNGVDTTGSKRLYIKSAIQVTTALGLYLGILIFSPPLVVVLVLYTLLGLNLAVLGFNIMHEGAHNSFSKRGWLNRSSAYLLNVLGGNAYFWKVKHNINHHTFTNIDGHDSDIDIKPFMRLHEGQKRYGIHKFQHMYWVVLYSVSYIMWIFVQDFQKYFTGKIVPDNKQKLVLKEHFIFWGSKILYITAFILTPVLVLGILKALLGYTVMAVACGIFLSVVFQLAHTVEGTSFPVPDEETNRIEQEWAIHQINTTANFATNNKTVSWLLGGLNFQVEHHLFPKISHVHYPGINRLVKETCQEFNVNYLEYPTMGKAFNAHLRHIKRMGRSN